MYTVQCIVCRFGHITAVDGAFDCNHISISVYSITVYNFVCAYRYTHAHMCGIFANLIIQGLRIFAISRHSLIVQLTSSDLV